LRTMRRLMSRAVSLVATWKFVRSIFRIRVGELSPGELDSKVDPASPDLVRGPN